MNAGRDAEGDDVGQRVELHAELAGGLHEPRDLPSSMSMTIATKMASAASV